MRELRLPGPGAEGLGSVMGSASVGRPLSS